MKKEKKKNNDSKKKRIITITIVIIILTSLITYFYLYNKKSTLKYETEIKEISKQNSMAIIDYKEDIANNTTWTYEDLENKLIDKNKLVKGTEIKITINDKTFKDGDTYTFVIGKTKIVIYLSKEYTYKIFKEEEKRIENKKEIIINIKDTTAPVIEGVKDHTINVGDKFNILDGITAKDDVDGDIEVKVEGEVDLNKAGTYKVNIYAEDKSGNKTTKEMTVTVKKKTTTTTKPSTGSTGSTGSSGTTGGNTTTTGCTYTATLKKRGYNSKDPDACEKDRQASAIAMQIANEIKAKGYGTDLEKVQAAAEIVSSYYVRENHIEEGYDYRTPYGVFVTHAASCAGCTRALIQVLEYLGFSCQHANENGWTHQWVILTMDGQVGFADGQVGVAGYGEY